jgi:hypothetical protein
MQAGMNRDAAASFWHILDTDFHLLGRAARICRRRDGVCNMPLAWKANLMVIGKPFNRPRLPDLT